MLRNSNTIASNLNDEQIKVLQKLEFKEGLFRTNDINHNTEYLDKRYECCGEGFHLTLDLTCNYEKKYLMIVPSDNFFTDKWEWTLQEFSSEIEKFQKQLQSDLKALRKVGIIS